MVAIVVYWMGVSLALEAFALEGLDRVYMVTADQLRRAAAIHVDANGTLSLAIDLEDWGDHSAYITGRSEGQTFGLLLMLLIEIELVNE
jgi:hypothetical protein